jgi:cell division protein FtsN
MQAGAFYSRKNAEKLKDRVSEIMPDYDISIERDGDLFKVRISGIESAKDAEKFKRKL